MEGLISPLSKEALDIELIKKAIKNDLIKNNVITDINYEGSNISVLVQIMAYLVYNVNASHALNANQTMLLLSNVRQNIIYLSKQLGYNISRPVSSKMNITLSIDSLNTNETLLIPKGTIFSCGDYEFILTDNISFNNSNLDVNTTLIQGVLIDYTIDSSLRFSPTVSTDRFTLNYTDIENNNLFIRTKSVTDINFSDYYTKVDSLLKLTNNKKCYYDDLDAETEFLNVYTSFAGQGKILSSSDIVDVSFIQTVGSLANNIVLCEFKNTDTFISNLNNSIKVTITVNEASSGGSDKESNDSIKQSAPLFYNSGNRTINKDDYNSFLEKNSLIESANSWGGESEVPLNLGHVYMTMLPQINRLYLTDSEKYDLLQYMSDTHTLAIGLIIIQPKYYSMDYTIKILGDVVLIDDKKQQIQDILTNYYNSDFNKFNTLYFSNKVKKQIESVLNDTASTKITTSLKLRISKEHFDELSTNLKYFIPNSNKRLYLVKNGIKRDIPDSNQDLYSYMIDGWKKSIEYDNELSVTFSGTINGKNITEGTLDTIDIDNVTYNKKDILLNDVVIGYFNIDLCELVITEDITSDLVNDGFINISYNDEINVEFLKSSVLTLGSITFE